MSPNFQVFVDKLPVKVKSNVIVEALAEHEFTVKKCKIIPGKNKKKSHAYITLTSHEEVDRLMTIGKVFVESFSLKFKVLKKRDALPGQKKYRKLSVPTECDLSPVDEAKPSMHMLHNYALLEVFKHLDLPESIRVTQVCRRWLHLIYAKYGRLSAFDYKDTSKKDSWTSIMQTMDGWYIGDSPDEPSSRLQKCFLKMIVLNGENLTALSICGGLLTQQVFRAIGQLAKNLESLEIKFPDAMYISDDTGLHLDLILKMCTKLKSLKLFDLYPNSYPLSIKQTKLENLFLKPVESFGIGLPKTLKTLEMDLYNFLFSRDFNFYLLTEVACITDLKTLKLYRDRASIFEEHKNQLSSIIPEKLECLKINISSFFVLCKLGKKNPNLKVLHLNVSECNDNMLEELADKVKILDCVPNLDELAIISSCIVSKNHSIPRYWLPISPLPLNLKKLVLSSDTECTTVHKDIALLTNLEEVRFTSEANIEDDSPFIKKLCSCLNVRVIDLHTFELPPKLLKELVKIRAKASKLPGAKNSGDAILTLKRKIYCLENNTGPLMTKYDDVHVRTEYITSIHLPSEDGIFVSELTLDPDRWLGLENDDDYGPLDFYDDSDVSREEDSDEDFEFGDNFHDIHMDIFADEDGDVPDWLWNFPGLNHLGDMEDYYYD